MVQRSLDLHFTIEREDDGFVATCTDLDVASQGGSVEEALGMCKEAVELYIEVLAEDGDLDRVLQERGLVPRDTASIVGEPGESFSTMSRVLVSAG